MHAPRPPRCAGSGLVWFGDFELDLERLDLFERGKPIAIHRTPLRLLAYLVRNAERFVSKEELLLQVWSDVVVSDTAISSALKELRRKLHDDGAHQRVVETRRGAGYRFVAPLASASPAAAPSAPSALAVLPLENLSGDPGQDFFAAGMTEALTNALSRLQGLRVLSRAVSMAYQPLQGDAREIARELGVELLVTGSVAREGRRVRISAQLFECESGSVLWSEQYDRDAGELLPLEGEVAEAIARAIDLELTPEEEARLSPQPIDPRAYDACLRGRYLYRSYTRESVQRASHSLLVAVATSPEHAPAHVTLASCYHALCTDFGTLSRDEAFPFALRTAERAIGLDPCLGEARALRGELLARYAWRWEEAEEEVRRAVELSPGNPECLMAHARLNAALGRSAASLDLGRRAVRLDPLSLRLRLEMGRLLWCSRRYDEAVAEQCRVVSLDPELAIAHGELGSSLHRLGRHREAVTAWRKFLQLSGLSASCEAAMVRAFEEGGVAAYWQNWIDEAGGANAMREAPPSWMWIPYAALGDLDRAFEWIERELQRRGTDLADLRVNPYFDPLRGDVRYAALLERIGLAEA